MMSYQQPKASWSKVSLRDGEWHVLSDGQRPIYKFTDSRVAAAKEMFAIDYGWSRDMPDTCEKTDGGYRFWSSGRWIVVEW